MKKLIQRLRLTRLFAPLSAEQLTFLLEQNREQSADQGSVLVNPEQPMHAHLILVSGELETYRHWITASGEKKEQVRRVKPFDQTFACVPAGSRGIKVTAITPVRYWLIEADRIDEIIGWNQEYENIPGLDRDIQERMKLVKRASVFLQIPIECVKTAFERMQCEDYEEGDVILTQGEIGNYYYLVDSGEVEIVRTDPFTDETATVAKMSHGDTFGEEALLQDGFRNATVKMTSPGRIYKLKKADFDELIKPNFLTEISAVDAKSKLQSSETKLIDCRFDMEYEESRIPGTQFLPLDRLRWDVHQLNPDVDYIVYCRSGCRSKAAAFLLRERNIKATSLIGGIRDWPYEIDAEMLDLSKV